MARKRAVIALHHSPHSSAYLAEGLRAAVGIMAGDDEHMVEVVFLGDGVYGMLVGMDRRPWARHLAALVKQGVRLRVEKESLEALGISPQELAPEAEVVPRSRVSLMMSGADFTVDF